ncbi:MAG: peptidylprolyl isomerase, partial [Alistipes sp.]|nr:peptidylprolyl isomerase [Alistipes sp.]
MIRKIMLVAAFATSIIFSAERAVAQERRQVMLDKVVAVVGGSAILHSELVEYSEALVMQRRQMGYTSDRDIMNESLEALLEQKLLYNQARIDSVDAPTSDIAARIENYVQAQVAEVGGIAQLEAKEHMPLYTYREMLRQRYEEQAYAQAMKANVVGKVTIVPGEVERFYKRVDKDSLPMIG